MIADVRAKVSERIPLLDVEFIQLLQDMIGDLTSSPEPVEIKLFSAGSRRCCDEWAPKVGDRIKKITEWWTCWTASRTPSADRRYCSMSIPVAAARAGFTPQEIELDASAILQGEPAPTPVVVNDRAYTIRVRFPGAVARP